MEKLSFFLLVSLSVYQHVRSANILFFHQIASYSHQVASYPLADELAKRGHQVTYITPWHPQGHHTWNPNITLLVPEKLRETLQTFVDQDFHVNYRVEKKFPRIVYQFFPTAVKSCHDILNSPELAEWMKKTEKLDLVFVDNCFSAECAMAISYKYKAKHIVFSTINHLGYEYDQIGMLPESSAIPELEIEVPQTPMTFWERVVNTLISLHFRWVHYLHNQKIDEIVRKWVKDPNMPNIDDLARNASLVFYTSDVITDFARSHPPLVVNIGGLHCGNEEETGGKEKQLPPDIKQFLEKDEDEFDGFFYISFGSVTLSSKLPEAVKQVFFDTVKAFPKLKFLWKWNGPHPEKKDLSENVFLAPWFPQVDILAHPKVRGFISQGGRPSMMEAVCNAVPMITFPCHGDQDNNANRLEKVGATIKLELSTVTRTELKAAVQKVAFDPGSKERMLEILNILKDQPMPALEKAVWWTEYVLRHKDTTHLRPAGFDQFWYQRRLLDVWAFLFVLILGILSLIITLLSCCIKHAVRKGNGNRVGRPKNKKE